MTKLLILFAIVAFIYAATRPRAPRKPQEPKVAIDDQSMTQCAHCGIYVPETESIREGGSSYCGEEHRQAALRS